ncbi:GPR39-like protein [Mya arenaria]|uniref:GPR39-like protein n=1 Tax=Mya arenaria TaxID=6604 RepID=A0ABY7GBP7_MYAAR|nr:GPR39-like protein [Mya arenaria]
MENRSFANETAVEIYSDIALNIIQKANKKQFHIFLPSFSVLCVLLIVGIPGNCLALFVYSKKLKRGIARGLFMTLITGDILSCLIVVPFELHIMNHFFDNYDELSCKLLRLFSYSVNNITSIVLLGIAFERYRVICTPWKSMLSPSTIRRTCYLIVIVSILYAIPMYFLYGIQTIALYSEKRRVANFTMKSYSYNLTLSYKTIRASSDGFTVFGKSCLTDDNHRESSFPLIIVHMYIVSIILEFLILVFLYLNVILLLSKRRKMSTFQQNDKWKRKSAKRVRYVTLTAFVLTLSYVVCYLPCLVCVCIRLWIPGYYRTLSEPGKMLFQLFLKFFLLDSAINPIIYCYCNKDFRQALISCLKLDKCRKEHSVIETGNAECNDNDTDI